MPPFTCHSSKPPGAFALVTSLVMMAFVVVLLLALAGLLRVETLASSASLEVIEARQNALFGLQMAMGELQKQLGPDQRVSAPSSLGQPATGADPRVPHLTGAWRQSPTASGLVEAAYKPELLAWLVNGNEKLSVGDPTYLTPRSLFDLPLPESDQDVVWLVGSNSVEVPATINAANPDPRIRMRTSPIGSRGRYAWWVGDQGVKASINVRDPLINDPTAAFARQSAVRSYRIDAMTGLSSLAPVIGSKEQEDWISPRSLRIASVNISEPILKSRFHDLTGETKLLLADVANGGLRQDLTYLLSLAPESEFARSMNVAFLDISDRRDWFSTTSEGNSIVQPGVTMGFTLNMPATAQTSFADIAQSKAGPTWEQLRSFYRAGIDLPSLGETSPALVPVAQTAKRQGFYPLLNQLKLGVGLRRETSDAPTKLWLHTRPLFVLANPYNVAMAPGDYYVIYRMTGRVQIAYDESKTAIDPVTGLETTQTETKVLADFGRDSLFNGLRFRLRSRGIPPGEAHVFTLDRTGDGPGWDASTESFLWQKHGTYPMTDDFDSLASIRYDASASKVFSHEDASKARVASTAGDVNAMLLTGSPSDESTILHYLRSGSSSANAYLSRTALGNGRAVRFGGGWFQRLVDIHSRSAGTGAGLQAALIADTNLRTLFPYSGIVSSIDARLALLHSGANQSDDSAFFEPLSQVSFLNMDDNRRTTWLMNTRANGAPAVPQVVLFHVPRSPDQVNSLGQLQHFNASGFIPVSSVDGLEFKIEDGKDVVLGIKQANNANPKFTDIQTAGYVPSYVIGNSRATQYVKREELASRPPGITDRRIFRDFSYLINDVLFDRFYFSTVPQTGAFPIDSEDLLNHRYRPLRPGVPIEAYRNSGNSASQHLAINGGFNINSTSVEAWVAFLSPLLGVPYGNEPGDENSGPFARSPHQALGSKDSDLGTTINAWAGFRRLTRAEIRTLAVAIVEQVRKRGPFLSLADFVNRRLISSSDDVDRIGIAGALETAVNPPLPATPTINARFTQSGGTSAGRQDVTPARQLPTTHDRDHVARHYLQGFPGWLSQGDLLQPMAPYLGARSDTFVIRAYGEVRRTKGGSVQKEAQAWCEAVVQRVPDFVDESQPPTTSQFGIDPLNDVNRTFGRRFEVVSFRWLNPDEI